MRDQLPLDDLPEEYRSKIGNFSLKRGMMNTGEDGEILLLSYDMIPRCTDIACSATEYCTYPRPTKFDSTLRCGFMAGYLKGVSIVVFRNFKDKFNEVQWTKVGLHLMPLYRNLARMKIEELGLVSIFREDARGCVSMHPLYREIREQIKSINAEWQGILAGVEGWGNKGLGDNPDLGDREFVDNLAKRGVREEEGEIWPGK